MQSSGSCLQPTEVRPKDRFYLPRVLDSLSLLQDGPEFGRERICVSMTPEVRIGAANVDDPMSRILLKGSVILVVGSFVSKPFARTVLVVNVVAASVFSGSAQARLLPLKTDVPIVLVVPHNLLDLHCINKARYPRICEEASYPISLRQFCAHMIRGACSKRASSMKGIWGKSSVGGHRVATDFHLVPLAERLAVQLRAGQADGAS